MLSLLGVYNCKADSKFRVSVPAHFRKMVEQEGQSVWVVRRSSTDDCLDMYPLNVWEVFLQRLNARVNPLKPDHAEFLREFFRTVYWVEMDANGRVLLPKNLLTSVGIEREMVMAGLGDRVQIWNGQKYDSLQMSHEKVSQLIQNFFND
ncbi:MAG: hypothetical protein J6K74_06765 [Marinifilaceae bacterium]|nr:hypothetical protein [Marinifilaceae bacterium]